MSDFKEYSVLCHEELKDLLRTLAVIPAPSHHEDKRVAFVKAWMEANGGENIFVDYAKNVIWPYHVTADNDLVVVMAHTDLVFSEDVPLDLREENGRFYCPGISDDTARLIDEEVQHIINEQYARAKQILTDNAQKHNALADLLCEKEVIFAKDVEDIFGARPWKSRADILLEEQPATTESEEPANADSGTTEYPASDAGDNNDGGGNIYDNNNYDK